MSKKKKKKTEETTKRTSPDPTAKEATQGIHSPLRGEGLLLKFGFPSPQGPRVSRQISVGFVNHKLINRSPYPYDDNPSRPTEGSGDTEADERAIQTSITLKNLLLCRG